MTLTVMYSNMREYLASKTYLSPCYVGMFFVVLGIVIWDNNID